MSSSQQFQVSGMTCGHCEKAVRRALQQSDAQAQVTVDLPSGRVEVQSSLPRAQLAEAITEAGYTVA